MCDDKRKLKYFKTKLIKYDEYVEILYKTNIKGVKYMLKDSFNNINLFNKSLTASWMKNQAVSNNIANVNTPNFKRETVNFEDMLRNSIDMQMAKTNSKHITMGNNANPIVVKDTSTSFRKDGNNVNIDVEMAELAENQIKYNALTSQLNDTFKRLRIAIKQG